MLQDLKKKDGGGDDDAQSLVDGTATKAGKFLCCSVICLIPPILGLLALQLSDNAHTTYKHE